MGSRHKGPLFLNLVTEERTVLRLKHRPLNLRRETPPHPPSVCIEEETEILDGLEQKNLLTLPEIEARLLSDPARSLHTESITLCD